MSKTTAVLIVDDNPPMAKTIADILTMKGYKVYVANSGADALEILGKHEVHLMLTDVIMPEMDGIELYRRTKQTNPRMITFLMTAYAADNLIQDGMAEGIKTILNKPLNIKLLLDLIESVERVYIHPH